MRCVAVKPNAVSAAWPLVKTWVANALQRGKSDQTPADVLRWLQAGSAQLWLAWPERGEGYPEGKALGCCITELNASARGRTCNLVVVAGGDFPQWQQLVEPIKEWAREQGCVRLEASGRAGWERRLRDPRNKSEGSGWQRVRVTMEMAL